MNNLIAILEDFWMWTGLPQEKWNNVDFRNYGIEPVDYPLIGELCRVCTMLINKDLSDSEMQHFLTALAIDAEDEDVLNACKTQGNNIFLYHMALCGISHIQSEARWQIADLLQLPIQNRNHFLQVLLSDTNAYVRKRANNTALDLTKGSSTD